MGKANRRKQRKNNITHKVYPANDKNALPNEITNKNTKKITIIICSLLIVATPLAWLVVNWLQKPAKVLLKGTLEKAVSLETSFSNGPEDGISLGCGCIKPVEANYRGIGIISDELYFSNGNEYGGFIFIATRPGPTSIVPQLSFEGTIFQIAVDNYSKRINNQELHTPEVWRHQNPFDSFLPNKLLDPTFKNLKIVSTFKFRDAYSLHLNGVRDIHVNQFGPIPFVAWNPTAGGQIRLNFDQGQGEISITESVGEKNPDVKEIGDKVFIGNEIIHPVADLVGTPLLIWSDRISSVILDDRLVPRQYNSHRPTFTVVLIKAAFSIRMISLSSSSSVEPWMGSFLEFDEKIPLAFDKAKKDDIPDINMNEAYDSLSGFLGKKIENNDIAEVRAGLIHKPDLHFFNQKYPKNITNDTIDNLSKIGLSLGYNFIPWGYHERESDQPGQNRIIPTFQGIAKRNKTDYTVKSYIGNDIKEKKLIAQKTIKDHTSLGTSLWYGQNYPFEYGYPSIGEEFIMLRGFDPWLEIAGAKGQLQLASELKQLVGGNNIKINISSSNNKSNIALNFLNDGQSQLEMHSDLVEIDNNGYFRNFDKHKTLFAAIAYALAFLGLRQISDYFKLFRHIGSIFKKDKQQA
jgi:hypothetical protein